MTMLVDVHCHLTHEKFSQDLDLVIKRAKKMVVVCAGSGHRDNQAVIRLSSKHPNIKPSLGLYPWDGVGLSEDEIELCADYIKSKAKQVVLIGEVGLDYYWGKGREDLKKQKWVFNRMLELSLDIKKPVLIHCRSAEADVLEIIKGHEGRVIIHCYTGPQNLVKSFLDLGCYFTIPAFIVRSKGFVKLCKQVPVNRLLTETDSPYLPPVQGQRNEPINVKFGIEKIAEVKKLSFKAVEEQVFKNYKGLTSD